MGAASEVKMEIVVSDYGSLEHEGHKEAVEAEGAVYVRTETDGVWSRSRALNAGLAVTSGRVVVATDADMVFSPGTIDAVVRNMDADPLQFIVMQCNDLPEGIDHEAIESGQYSWDQLEKVSTLRPRWGMGGLIAIPRAAYVSSRGLDERMEIYGGEDIDFAKRMRRLGLKLHWLQDQTSRMYHVWHPSSRVSADETAAGRRAISINREIQLKDPTAIRNLTNWIGENSSNAPQVSVVISTHNRADYLHFAILSTLAQTMKDFELIIIDDGSSDHTAEVVAAFNDPRVRYYKREQAGLAAARNFATSVARGRYIAVMDDDDMMLPSRLEHSLKAVVDGANGAYGGWIDFSDETGERVFRTGKKLSVESLLFNGGTYLHPTLLVERRWMETIPYDESMRSGSDYNLASRMLRSGVRLNHSGKYVLMRRIHGGQITNLDPSIQKASGAISAFWGRASMLSGDIRHARVDRNEKDKTAIEAQRVVEPKVLEYLPDHLVRRKVLVQGPQRSQLSPDISLIVGNCSWQRLLQTSEGDLVQAEYFLEDVPLSDIYALRSCRELSITVESEILEQSAELKTGEYLRIPGIEAARVNGPDYRLAIGWIVDNGMASFADDFVILRGDEADLDWAAVEVGIEAVKFIWGEGHNSVMFSIFPCGGRQLRDPIDIWRATRGGSLSMSVVSDMERN
nr:glycosyltransferase [Brachybacterium muris]